MRYALGIDGGGSKCDAVLVDETGRTVAHGRGGPVHTYYDPPEVVAASFHKAVSDALRGMSGIELWIAGNLPPDAVLQSAAASCGIANRLPAGEIDTGFAVAQEQWGMIVLAGTGSFVYARRPDGRSLYVGAMGPVLGDYGSAYAIGLGGLRAAFASRWLTARRSSLQSAVPQHLGVPDLRAVFKLVYVDHALGRRQIGSIARAVDREAEKGDRVAIQCLTRAADELADLAVDVVRELDMESLRFPVIAIGSVAQRSRIWWNRMCRRIAEVAPSSRPMIPRLQPAAGAALLALRQMGIPWTPELLDRMAETHRPLLEAIESDAKVQRDPATQEARPDAG